jgi:hypothetical protein
VNLPPSNKAKPTPVVLSDESLLALREARVSYRDHLILMALPGGLWVADQDDGEAIAWTGLACQCHTLTRADGGPCESGAVLHGATVILALQTLTDVGCRVALVEEDTPGHAPAFQFIEPVRPAVPASIDDVALAMGRLPAQFRSFASGCIISWLEKIRETLPANGHCSPRLDLISTDTAVLPALNVVTDLGRVLARLNAFEQRHTCRLLLDMVKKNFGKGLAAVPPEEGAAFDPFRDWVPGESEEFEP